jgi:hypothetical protein
MHHALNDQSEPTVPETKKARPRSEMNSSVSNMSELLSFEAIRNLDQSLNNGLSFRAKHHFLKTMTGNTNTKDFLSPKEKYERMKGVYTNMSATSPYDSLISMIWECLPDETE